MAKHLTPTLYLSFNFFNWFILNFHLFRLFWSNQINYTHNGYFARQVGVLQGTLDLLIINKFLVQNGRLLSRLILPYLWVNIMITKVFFIPFCIILKELNQRKLKVIDIIAKEEEFKSSQLNL